MVKNGKLRQDGNARDYIVLIDSVILNNLESINIEEISLYYCKDYY